MWPAKTPFIEELKHLGVECGAQFHEYVLNIDVATLAERLARRAMRPDRLEHTFNNSRVRPDDAARLIQSLNPLRATRPRATWIDARGPLEATVNLLRAHLDPPPN